jgi:hypothetical protein
VMSLANASDAELGYLATGELPTEDSDDTQ